MADRSATGVGVPETTAGVVASVTVFGSTVISVRRVATSAGTSSWKRPPRCFARNFSVLAIMAMLLTGRAKPCPSSGATMYSTGKPRSRSAMTIWSDSARLTRGSFCPWTTISGVRILSAELSGDCFISRALSSGLPGSPMRTLNTVRIDSQYGGIESSSVSRFDGATMATPAA